MFLVNFRQYTFEAAKIACGNVAGLISWTIAMAQFYAVNKDVLPLKANLAIMQGKYQGAKKELDAAEALLAAKEVRSKLNYCHYSSMCSYLQVPITNVASVRKIPLFFVS